MPITPASGSLLHAGSHAAMPALAKQARKGLPDVATMGEGVYSIIQEEMALRELAFQNIAEGCLTPDDIPLMITNPGYSITWILLDRRGNGHLSAVRGDIGDSA